MCSMGVMALSGKGHLYTGRFTFIFLRLSASHAETGEWRLCVFLLGLNSIHQLCVGLKLTTTAG